MNTPTFDVSRRDPGAHLATDICIVGSGCGGATAARTLAEAGREVLVLEEGGDFIGPALTQRDLEMYDHLYMDRGGRSTADAAINVLQGRVLGGGGVINACDVVPIPEAVWRLWRKRFGLSDLTPETVADCERRALHDLSASRIGEDELNRNNRVLQRGAVTLGWRGEIMLHNRVGCAGLGTCLIGCPLNAKRNPRFVAIPRAIEKGARFLLRARAVRIDDAGKERKRITVRRLDPRGYREQGVFTISARTVILAANAIGSAQLLLRSGLGNEHVGEHLILQPQLPIVAFFDEELRAFDGIPQSFAVTEFQQDDHPEHGWWGFRIESISGTPGISASIMPELGPAGKQLMTLYPHLASALLLLPDQPSGRLRVERSGRLRINYRMRPEYKQRVRAAVRAAARLYLAAGARSVVVPTTPPLWFRREKDLRMVDDLPLAPARAPFISAHQQGTVRFAPSARDGGADPNGQVYGTRGVYVFDSSGFPSSASSHTMAPILTVAEWLARRLAT